MSQPGDNSPSNDGRIQRADPAYRRQMLRWLVVALVLGFAALAALNVWLIRLDHTVAQADIFAYHRWLSRILAGIGLVLAATALGFGAWMMRLARATGRDRRWPPNGYRTTADVRIRYLTSADGLVVQLKAGVYALFLIAAALIGWAAWLLHSA